MIGFVVCTCNALGDASGRDLGIGKIYEVLAIEKGLVRLVDDSGQDYLYPASCFEQVALSEQAAMRLRAALRISTPLDATAADHRYGD